MQRLWIAVAGLIAGAIAAIAAIFGLQRKPQFAPRQNSEPDREGLQSEIDSMAKDSADTSRDRANSDGIAGAIERAKGRH